LKKIKVKWTKYQVDGMYQVNGMKSPDEAKLAVAIA